MYKENDVVSYSQLIEIVIEIETELGLTEPYGYSIVDDEGRRAYLLFRNRSESFNKENAIRKIFWE